uniref:Major facilitator superfamily (MFS) profile domain-containing protein n=1 Tax=Acrobeloides nanus TaxID=290746 RepID=A0A914C740_9BILA
MDGKVEYAQENLDDMDYYDCDEDDKDDKDKMDAVVENIFEESQKLLETDPKSEEAVEKLDLIHDMDHQKFEGLEAKILRKFSRETATNKNMAYENRKVSTVTLRNSTRFAILALSTICLSLLLSNSLALNFTIICMTNDGASNDNETSASDYNYSPIQRGWLFSIVAVGQIIGTVILTYCSSKFDIRYIFSIYGLSSAFATLLTPLSAYTGFVPLLVMRLIQGFGTATSYNALGSITQQWSTIKESGMYIALMSCHQQFSNIFTMPIAGALCESSWGWSSLYYLQGTLTLFFFVLFYIFYRDDPYCHKFVSDKELIKIEHGKINVVTRDANVVKKKIRPPSVPYKSIFMDKVVWGILISALGGQIGFLVFVLFGPTYLNKVLGFDIKSTGVGTAVPFIGAIIVKIVSGPFSDNIGCISVKKSVIMFATISQTMLGISILTLAFIPMEYPILAQIAFIAAISFSGLNAVGVTKCASLISQHYSYVLMTCITVIAGLVTLTLPMFVAALVPDNTHSQWKTIFVGSAIIIFVSIAIFDITSEVEPRSWVFKKTKKVFTIPIEKTSIEPEKIPKV